MYLASHTVSVCWNPSNTAIPNTSGPKNFGFLFLLVCITVNAQKELWGVTRTTNYSDLQGNIVKFDINGENAQTMHQFNYLTGKLPQGKLFLASNGKMYGTATFGGTSSTTNTTEEDGNGVLYEYDLTFDTYKVVHFFDGILASHVNPTSSLIEPVPGKLYGGTAHGGFYVYDIASETLSYLNHAYSFAAMGAIYSDLIKASNGFVYAISGASFPCTVIAPDQPNQGSIIKINTTNNTAQRVAVFGCNSGITVSAFGGYSMVEALPNKIFFLTGSSMYLASEGFSYPVGGIIEFNTSTNALTQKFTFDPYNSLGFSPSSLLMGANGNLFGVCSNGGDTYRFPFTSGLLNKAGTLFEYNLNSNTIVKLTEFLTYQNSPQTIINLTMGNFTGNLGNGGLYKYDINANALQFPDGLTYSDLGNQFSTQNLVEICRKPAYHFFDVDTFDACMGGNFSYDIQNTNATTYQWLKDGTNVLNQTSRILTLTNLSPSDAGNYTCLMSNDCGTTTTMVLHLTINCLGTGTLAFLDKSIKLYPNPTKDILNIKLPENITVNINSIKIANSIGQVMREEKIQNNYMTDVSQLKTGIYFISLETNYGRWNGKFLKE